MKIKLLKLIVFTIALFGAGLVKAQGGADEWRYDIECAGTGTEGSYLVTVWSYGKKPNMSTEEMKKNAIHGVLFRGFAGAQGCTAQKPIIKSPAVLQEKAEFFTLFFGKEGTYLKYATVVSATPEIVKIKKNEYKIGQVFSISKDLLRKDMEAAGIIKSLGAGF